MCGNERRVGAGPKQTQLVQGKQWVKKPQHSRNELESPWSAVTDLHNTLKQKRLNLWCTEQCLLRGRWMTRGRGYAGVHADAHACIHKSHWSRSVFSIEHKCSNWILNVLTFSHQRWVSISLCALGSRRDSFIGPELFFFSLYAKSWRGAASRRDCHRAPKLPAQMWSAVQKVTPSCSLMESQRKKRTRPARVLARKSL